MVLPDGEEHKMAWLDEVNNRNTQYHYMKHFIVYYNDKAIGFCLYLDCYFEKEYIPEHYGKTVDEKETVFEIGYLIGEEEYWVRASEDYCKEADRGNCRNRRERDIG